jgi:hypothetical protein
VSDICILTCPVNDGFLGGFILPGNLSDSKRMLCKRNISVYGCINFEHSGEVSLVETLKTTLYLSRMSLV